MTTGSAQGLHSAYSTRTEQKIECCSIILRCDKGIKSDHHRSFGPPLTKRKALVICSKKQTTRPSKPSASKHACPHSPSNINEHLVLLVLIIHHDRFAIASGHNQLSRLLGDPRGNPAHLT
jgi:hypothetical protein